MATPATTTSTIPTTWQPNISITELEEIIIKFSGSLRNNQQLPEVSSAFTKLLHIADPDIQNIFETLTHTGTEYQHALNTCFYIKKSILFERSVIHKTTQQKSESIKQVVTKLRIVNFKLQV